MTEKVKKNAMKTGFCFDGNHEGTKPKSHSGLPMKTCEFWQTCPCECHEMITRMFEETGMERLLIDNPEYRHVKSPFWMPSLLDTPLESTASNGSGAIPATVVQGADPAVAPPRVAASYAPTSTGRAARGELESHVQEATDDWTATVPEYKCTPDWINEWLAEKYGMNASVGAIHAVFMRWEKLGFAYIEKKPVRFLGYTPDGIKYGLERLKIKSKREKKQRQSAANRGERR